MKKSTLVILGAAGLFCFSANAQTTVFSEGFEAGVPPSGWTADNPDGLTTFGAGSAGYSGSSSAFMDVWNTDASGAEQGQADALITPVIDLSGVTSPMLSFYYAFQMFSDPATYTNSDLFTVYTSTDGGASWNSVYTNTGVALVTATPQFDQNQGFVPTPSDWAQASSIDKEAQGQALVG